MKFCGYYIIKIYRKTPLKPLFIRIPAINLYHTTIHKWVVYAEK